MIRKGPRFTEAARAAAALKRRERAAIKAETKSNFEVFVLRSAESDVEYIWEIRQYGGVLIERAERTFGCSAEARSAGLRQLALMPAPPESMARPVAERALEMTLV